MTSERNVLCAGCVNWDVVLHTDKIPDPDYSSAIDSEQSKCGGSATNTALGLSSFGLETTIIGDVGTDKFGSKIESVLDDTELNSILTKNGVSTRVIYAIITEDADPRYFGMNEEQGEFGVETVPSNTWENVDHVHVTSFDVEIANEFARMASEDGKTVSFNPSQGYSKNVFDGVVDVADVIFLNERESSIFRDRHDFAEIIKEKVVVMTHGSAGSTVYSPEGIFTHTGYNISEIKDTIGAGDAFTAGFLTEWLEDPDNTYYKSALSLANASGAFAVRDTGSPEKLDSE